jgi:hypothetical protein
LVRLLHAAPDLIESIDCPGVPRAEATVGVLAGFASGAIVILDYLADVLEPLDLIEQAAHDLPRWLGAALSVVPRLDLTLGEVVDSLADVLVGGRQAIGVA